MLFRSGERSPWLPLETRPDSPGDLLAPQLLAQDARVCGWAQAAHVVVEQDQNRIALEPGESLV